MDLVYDWELWARRKQLCPDAVLEGRKTTWFLVAGRAFGKTRAGSEFVRMLAEEASVKYIGIIGPTANATRKVMVEGPSGILAVSHPGFMPRYSPSKLEIKWPNGVIAHTYSADEPERLRGPEHEAIWCDEPASWRYGQDTMDNAMMGLRGGGVTGNPIRAITGTPKPTKLVKDIIADEDTVVVKGTTYDNVRNLPPKYFSQIIRRYEGTRLGRQELNAEILDDVEGALWTRKLLDRNRVTLKWFKREGPDLQRIVVAVDPSTTNKEKSAECGIVIAGLGVNGHGYVLDDASKKDTPLGWASKAVAKYNQYGADRIAAEVNNGGDMVETTVRTIDSRVSYRAVHASRGKVARAEPVSALYEQGKVHHVGAFPQMEDELCEYTGDSGDPSPNRYDAVVWAITELFNLDNREEPEPMIYL